MAYQWARRWWVELGVVMMGGALSLLLACTSKARAPETPETPHGTEDLEVRIASTIVPEIAAVDRAIPPLGLTTSDGAGLRLVALEARAVVESPLAFTELTLSFENPEPRTLEGRFQVTLPPNASLSRFAMRIGEQWQEGEVVEKRRATQVYEDVLHQKQDPALLEQAAGNEFAARVFPIPAQGRKDIILSYSEELVGDAPYRLALGGLPEIQRLDLTVHVRGQGQGTARLVRVNERPAGDLVIPRRALGGHTGVRNASTAVLRVRPVATSPEPAPLGSTVLLFDTSASRALGFGAQRELLYRLAREVATDPRARLVVGCFDQMTEPLFDGPATKFDREALARIEQRGALGASDLGGAIEWASRQAKSSDIHRMVVVSDAVATMGGSAAARRAENVLLKSGLERLDFVLVGGIRDEDHARHLARALPKSGVVVSGETSWQEIARRLTRQTHSGLKVAVEGARWVWPRQLDGVQAGDEVLITAELPRSQALRITIDGTPIPAPLVLDGNAALVERAAARSRIASLLEQEREQGSSEELETRIVALSEKHRVLSPYTALLVLESQGDYDRFGIDRNALTNVLVVRDGQVATTELGPREPAPRGLVPGDPMATFPPDTVRATWRSRAPHQQSTGSVPFKPPPPPPPALGNHWGDTIGEAFGSGGLGLTGIGEGGGGRGEGIGRASVGGPGHGAGGQGFGSGHGRLGGSHRSRAPRVRMGVATVSGRLPPEVIQRVVRQNYGRMRVCYEQGLGTDPNLEGRVGVRFVIGADGAVIAASDAGSTIASARVVACVVQAFRTLTFPNPEGGVVAVVYPIQFGPEGSGVGNPTAARIAVGQPGATAYEGNGVPPWTGLFAELMNELAAGKTREGLTRARKWQAEQPGELLALIALGEAFTRSGDKHGAARAYGSLLDLYSFRADLRRYAAARLEALGTSASLELAIDSLRQAVEQRPDHPNSHRALGMALLRAGRPAPAFDALLVGYARTYPPDRFAGVKRILGEDLALAAAAWMKQEPPRAGEIRARLSGLGLGVENEPSLRFVLSWETDSNDVDFHIYDDRGSHAYYSEPRLPKRGGELYADVTTGYGPECFTIRRAKADRALRYTLFAHYYARGPMGYGLGRVQVIDHDGSGGLTFDDRPFVVMQDNAFVELGEVKH